MVLLIQTGGPRTATSCGTATRAAGGVNCHISLPHDLARGMKPAKILGKNRCFRANRLAHRSHLQSDGLNVRAIAGEAEAVAG